TVNGHGTPNKAAAHDVQGAALGEAEVAATRAKLGWTAEPFVIAAQIRAAWNAREAGAARQSDWQRRFAAYADVHPQLAAEFERRACRRALPAHWHDASQRLVAATAAQAASIASRKASQNA